MDSVTEDQREFEETTSTEVPETNENAVTEGGSRENQEKEVLESNEGEEPIEVVEYRVPRKIWERTVKELTAPSRKRSVAADRVRYHCKHIAVHTRLSHPMSLPTYMEMIQQAYVNKNWHNLYKIMHEALKLNRRELREQIFKVNFRIRIC